uniref:Integrase, catalytic region, zinc finger, CCHC-type, peptidase aspartic, catalytic n=1 Tax=Tanacetum cinerariifolium TaxID=118510 RepID=A0A699HT00_TANCI|nr:integrase, catalytic region, zinc finger, CCHC-type, peptidase aspartic, catalytic [Tanacetum cinerariifolium]
MNVAGARENEKMLLCKQAEKGVPLQAEQYDWLADTDEEIDEQELEAHYSYMEKIQENDQNDVERDDERVALANLIANLKLDVDENKKIQNKLKKANTTLAQELKECKTILAETSKNLGESNSVRDSFLVALQKNQTEFEKYKAFNDRTVDYDKLEQIVDNAWVKHTKDQFHAPTSKDMYILIKTCLMPLAFKTHNDSFIFVHELKKEMHADLKYVESLEKEIDELESDKAEFSNMYDMILQAFDYDHFACVTKMLNDVNARTKKPNVVPISTRKPKGHANKSVATPLTKKVASKSTPQKPKSYYRMMYAKTSKAWKCVRFGNDQFAPILGYRDLVYENITINMVYYVEGLNHNLFSVGQFCDVDLEVAFRKSTYFVRDL